ncbi:MAG TPA: DoxX family protein [Usitatibacter sp.]|jgi:putative oxidoreductase|nr:DoxX family protein [Usitatibacter sp.]
MSSLTRTAPPAIAGFYAAGARAIDRLQPVFALLVRLYVARVFFLSGLTKLRDWHITRALFENEFHVPLLPPELAAYLGTGAEIGLPILLAAGLGTRFAAAALFVFNIVAVVSYPDLSDAGLKDHMLWGALLLVSFVYGPGRWSADAFLSRSWPKGV